jgi:hypothetical protein
VRNDDLCFTAWMELRSQTTPHKNIILPVTGFLLVTVANNGNDINIDFRYFLMKHMEKSLKIIHFTKKIAFLSIKLTYLHICEGV